MSTIEVHEYDPIWKIEFKKAKTFYSQLIKNLDIHIEHVGSTSVKDQWAKPILDIDIIVNSAKDNQKVIKLLENAGYKHVGNLGIVGREAFKYDTNNPNITWMRHNLYLCINGCESLNNHLLLRNHLRNNPNAVEEYSRIKRQLAKIHPNDIDSYVEGKTAFISSVLEKEGMKLDSLKKIADANRKK